jgi:MoxR-like ATPase
LLVGAQARAATSGRDFVVPDDVKVLCPAALRHRVGLQPDAEIEGVTADDCVREILAEVRVPKTVAA